MAEKEWNEYWHGNVFKPDYPGLEQRSGFDPPYMMKTPKEGCKEAEEIGKAIVDSCYALLKEKIGNYGMMPIGGITGNAIALAESLLSYLVKSQKTLSQAQCGDWQAACAAAARVTRSKNKGGDIPSFKIIDKSIVIGEGPYGALGRKFLQHNWIEVEGPTGKRIVLDPWPSGGRSIIDDTFPFGGYTMAIDSDMTKNGKIFNVYDEMNIIQNADSWTSNYSSGIRERRYHARRRMERELQ